MSYEKIHLMGLLETSLCFFVWPGWGSIWKKWFYFHVYFIYTRMCSSYTQRLESYREQIYRTNTVVENHIFGENLTEGGFSNICLHTTSHSWTKVCSKMKWALFRFLDNFRLASSNLTNGVSLERENGALHYRVKYFEN